MQELIWDLPVTELITCCSRVCQNCRQFSVYTADLRTNLVYCCNIRCYLFDSCACYCISAWMCQMFWALGASFVVSASILIMPTVGWRYLLVIVAVPVIIMFIACFVSMNAVKTDCMLMLYFFTSCVLKLQNTAEWCMLLSLHQSSRDSSMA